jgi:polysaccharide export outer membrane protein
MLTLVLCLLAFGAGAASLEAQARAASGTAVPSDARPEAALPPGYVIGADDVLGIIFWKDADLSGDVTVRPDGKIALPLLNDVQAAGLTPGQLRDAIESEAKRFVADPNPTVVVRQINSRKVFITGSVAKPGMYPLNSSMSVVQLIALAGGLTEFAKPKDIIVMRNEQGRQMAYPFNYKDLIDRKNLAQNIELKPGDTVMVPGS